MFAKRFKDYRLDKKMTQKDFAEFIGIARSTVGDVEKGRVNANMKLLNKLVAKTGLGIEYWLSDAVIDSMPDVSFIDGENVFIALQSALNLIINTKGYDPVTKEIYAANMDSLIAILKEECKLKIYLKENQDMEKRED